MSLDEVTFNGGACKSHDPGTEFCGGLGTFLFFLSSSFTSLPFNDTAKDKTLSFGSAKMRSKNRKQLLNKKNTVRDSCGPISSSMCKKIIPMAASWGTQERQTAQGKRKGGDQHWEQRQGVSLSMGHSLTWGSSNSPPLTWLSEHPTSLSSLKKGNCFVL